MTKGRSPSLSTLVDGDELYLMQGKGKGRDPPPRDEEGNDRKEDGTLDKFETPGITGIIGTRAVRTSGNGMKTPEDTFEGNGDQGREHRRAAGRESRHGEVNRQQAPDRRRDPRRGPRRHHPLRRERPLRGPAQE